MAIHYKYTHLECNFLWLFSIFIKLVLIFVWCLIFCKFTYLNCHYNKEHLDVGNIAVLHWWHCRYIVRFYSVVNLKWYVFIVHNIILLLFPYTLFKGPPHAAAVSVALNSIVLALPPRWVVKCVLQQFTATAAVCGEWGPLIYYILYDVLIFIHFFKWKGKLLRYRVVNWWTN